MNRDKRIIKVSIIGIIVNIILVIFKSIVGLITTSIAIILDAINNLSDVLSSVITIIGTRLANRRPDKKHPYGYGRIEYFTSIIIAIIIIYAGFTSLKESIDKIINPTLANYSTISLIIIGVAVLTKFALGNYVKNQGTKLNSNSLVASGVDAISDSVISLSTLVTAVISIIWHISLEGYLGVIISIIILRLALKILKDTANEIIGIRADSNLVAKIKREVMHNEEVLGVYDITIHNYGHNKIIASLHIELDDEIKAKQIHRLTKKIETDIYNKFGIILTIGIYASNDEGKYKEIKEYLIKILKNYPNVKQMHGFYVDEEYKLITFDLVFSFDELEVSTKVEEIINVLKRQYPKYNYYVIPDTDLAD